MEHRDEIGRPTKIVDLLPPEVLASSGFPILVAAGSPQRVLLAQHSLYDDLISPCFGWPIAG
jgi:hypothetical protein